MVPIDGNRQRTMRSFYKIVLQRLEHIISLEYIILLINNTRGNQISKSNTTHASSDKAYFLK